MMRYFAVVLLMLVTAGGVQAQSSLQRERDEAEYYIRAYARHYGVPVAFARAIVQQESNWHRCAVSSKGAVGLMQLMPQTAKTLGVIDRCNIKQNVSGGIRYLAWLIHEFHGDLRLVAAAYYAPENIVARRGLAYRNPDVVTYVSRIRTLYSRGLVQEQLQAMTSPAANR